MSGKTAAKAHSSGAEVNVEDVMNQGTKHRDHQTKLTCALSVS